MSSAIFRGEVKRKLSVFDREVHYLLQKHEFHEAFVVMHFISCIGTWFDTFDLTQNAMVFRELLECQKEALEGEISALESGCKDTDLKSREHACVVSLLRVFDWAYAGESA